ncbi:DUF6620 family protein [Niabella beijingensis]|uniref:DUF6620 family protein n=1 Tax=Niabella beijingensis TaxID=2872700 RepID=UPI001CBF8816|nr:DUF6620 family protein [Niabella beijingensis]MBZ4192673.1 hypothetical protein [Niabella beijingensis]
MFKKMFKNITESITDMTQNAAKDQQQPDSYNEVLKAYGQGDMQKAMDVGAASVGMTTMNTATEDPNDPLLQPVHGITVFDYAAGAAKMGAGCTDMQVCKALGVELPLWEEAKTTWNNRMRDDKTYNMVNVYSKYFGKANEHEKLGQLVPDQAPATAVAEGAAAATLQRIETDKHYFFELQGALQAAYDNGLDGAQWLIDELGLTVAQVNAAGTKWMSDFNILAQMIDYQDQKKKEYNERFAKEANTGGVADDVEF